MSISILPRSDTVVALLWGDRWWIEGRSEPVAFGEFSRAAETLLAVFAGDRPARLRLVYQPAFLTATSVACPNGNRPILRQALGEEFPALASDDRAWGFEPIVGGHEHFATVLYYETEPGLYSLVAALHAAGVEVDGVWPLPTLLNLVPDDWPDRGALTVVAVAHEQALVFRHTSDGTREVQRVNGAEAEPAAMLALQTALGRSDVSLHLAALDEAGLRLAARFAPADAVRLPPSPWSRLVIAARTLPTHHPTQLLPRPAFFDPARFMVVATAAAVVAAAVIGAITARERWVQRAAIAVHEQARHTLQTEVEQMQAAEQDVARLRVERASLVPGPNACADLLRTLGHRLPSQVVLTHIQADRAGFVVSGGITAPGLTEAAWREWLAPAGSTRLRWTEIPTKPTADFRLKGVWQ